MAFVSSSSPDQDPNNPNQAGTQQANQAPVTSAPNAGGTGKATTPSNQSTAQPFANLSSYLTANAPAIQNEAAGISGNLTNTFNDTKSAIDTAAGKFGGQVNSGYTQYDPNVLSAFGASPTAVGNDPTKAAAFKGMYSDQYNGPSRFEDTPDYADLSGKVQAGTEFANSVGTPAGVQSYFTAKSPTYTQGMGTLDSALLQANPDAVTSIQKAAAPMSTLPGYLTSAVTSGNAAAQTAAQNAQAAKAAAQDAYTKTQGNVVNRINSEEAAAVKQAQDYNAAVQSAQSKVATDVPLANNLKNIMQQYGATFQGASAPWLDGSKVGIPNQVIGLPGADRVASGTDYSDIAALQALSGNPVAASIDPANAARAGTYQAPGAVDQSQLTNALTAMQNFIQSPDGTKINVASGANLDPFDTAANQWYNQLITELGYQYPGTGPHPAPFSSSGNTSGPGNGGGVGGFGGV